MQLDHDYTDAQLRQIHDVCVILQENLPELKIKAGQVSARPLDTIATSIANLLFVDKTLSLDHSNKTNDIYLLVDRKLDAMADHLNKSVDVLFSEIEKSTGDIGQLRKEACDKLKSVKPDWQQSHAEIQPDDVIKQAIRNVFKKSGVHYYDDFDNGTDVRRSLSREMGNLRLKLSRDSARDRFP
jgi:hypothetical protein